jgi:Lytic polysaccharide mono-oxygenase, cellulose-degrading
VSLSAVSLHFTVIRVDDKRNKVEKMSTKLKILCAVLLVNLVDEISGHGMLMDPVNRASRWRKDGSNPRDYDDMQGFCGGFTVQWSQNGGKCGLCGDNFSDAMPRTHELGGKFGVGVITKTYTQGATIPVTVKITANQKGYFYFKICNLDVEAESEACFERYKVPTTVGINWPLTSAAAQDYLVYLQLPSNLNCNRCVLQWTYVTGNNWGFCGDGTGRLGCGPQEHFRTCSDIRINKA